MPTEPIIGSVKSVDRYRRPVASECAYCHRPLNGSDYSPPRYTLHPECTTLYRQEYNRIYAAEHRGNRQYIDRVLRYQHDHKHRGLCISCSRPALLPLAYCVVHLKPVMCRRCGIAIPPNERGRGIKRCSRCRTTINGKRPVSSTSRKQRTTSTSDGPANGATPGGSGRMDLGEKF